MPSVDELAKRGRGPAFRIVLRLLRKPGMRMSEFTHESGTHATTALKLRNTLEEMGVVVVTRLGPQGAVDNNVSISLSPEGEEMARLLERADEVLARAARSRRGPQSSG